MFIKLNFKSDIPIYEQLKNEIIIGIAKQQLLPGERLPSVRQLASDIGINMHTVNKAYKQLEDEGFLIIHRQRGVIVHPNGAPVADEQFKQSIVATLRPMIAKIVSRNLSKNEFINIVDNIYDELGVDDDE